ncbi:hypothetical protein BJ138DRAFT_1199236, partial [Hygrophoropsis aurantiaca]
SSTKENIRNYHPDYLVTANSYPRFLYEGGKYYSDNPSNGLFKGDILVKAFKFIFTSPTSTSETRPAGEGLALQPIQKRSKTSNERRTRSGVAALLGM